LFEMHSPFAVHGLPSAARATHLSETASQRVSLAHWWHSLQCEPSVIALHSVGTPSTQVPPEA
jgi:hypothetical protein